LRCAYARQTAPRLGRRIAGTSQFDTGAPAARGLSNNSNAAGNNDWFNLLAGLVSRNPP
jgi:hypothetical protein